MGLDGLAVALVEHTFEVPTRALPLHAPAEVAREAIA
jgi:hypothetical protein